jgi:membrane-associated phospholipid phosphatase
VFLLMLVARKIGEYVSMGLKDHYLMRRPAEVYPWIMPLIDGPDTPSYPSGHSLQGHLISGALKLALTPQVPPVSKVQPNPYPETARALDVLADRVAYNREVAGVHYNMDSAAGAYGARICVEALYALPANSRFKKLVTAAKAQLSDLP